MRVLTEWITIMGIFRGVLKGKQLCFIGRSVELGKDVRLSPLVLIDDNVVIGGGTFIGFGCVMRSNIVIGEGCSFGHHTVVEKGVVIGNNVRIHSLCHIADEVVIGDEVFMGPGLKTSNVKEITSWGIPNTFYNYKAVVEPPRIKKGARIGVGVLLLPGIVVGEGSFIHAGSIVVKDVPDFAVVAGIPGRILGRVRSSG